MRDLNPPAEIRPAVDLVQLTNRWDSACGKEERAAKSLAEIRLEKGRILVEARKAFPARGPRAKGWGELLKKWRISEQAAREYMALAGYVAEREAAGDFTASRGNVPTLSEAGARGRKKVDALPAEEPPPVRVPRDPGWVCAACGAPCRAKDTACGKCGEPRDPVEHERARQEMIAKLNREAEERRQAALAPLRMEARENATAKAIDALETGIAAFNRLHGDGVHLSDCTASPSEFEEVKRRALTLYRMLREELRAIGIDVETDGGEPAPVQKRQLTLVKGDKP